MRLASIQLYRGEDSYCGSFWIRVDETNDRRAELNAAGFGLARDEDGTISRSFFFADEIDEMTARAERETGCSVEVDWLAARS